MDDDMPDAAPPAIWDDLVDYEAERNLAGCALKDGDNFLLDVAPAEFHDEQLAALWAAGQALVAAGLQVDLAVVQDKVREQGGEASLEWLSKLVARDIFSGNAPVWAAKVREMAWRRRQLPQLQDAARVLYAAQGACGADYLAALAAAHDRAARGLAQPAVARTSTWADIAAQLAPVTFDWPGWLAPGFLSLLVSASGEGKSNLLLRIAGVYLCGWAWPDGAPYGGVTGKVLWCEAEAAQAMNSQRAQAWGLPLEHILSPLADPLDDVDLLKPQHRDVITALAGRDDVRLVAVDSLSAACHGLGRAEDLMPVMLWLAALARDTGKPVIVLHHLRKRGLLDTNTGVLLDRVRDSTVIVQLARVVWAIDTPDLNDTEHKRLSVIKSNLAAFPEPLGIRIGAAGVECDAAPQPPRVETQLDKACELLQCLLDRQPVTASELEAEANAAGISWDTMKRAKEKLRIVARRDGRAGRWLWSLPYLAPAEQEGQPADT